MKYITFVIIIILHIAALRGQSPYNYKVYDFNKRSLFLNSLQPIDHNKYGLIGLYVDTINGNPEYVKTNSFITLLDENLNTICSNEVLPNEIDKSTWFYSKIIQINQDSFIACGESIEVDSNGAMDKNLLYFISIDSTCNYKKLKEISIPYSVSKRQFGQIRIQRSQDNNYFYVSYFREYSSTGYESCILKLSKNLDIIWHECYDALDYNNKHTNLFALYPLIFTDSGTIALPAIRFTEPGDDNILSQLQFIHINPSTGIEMTRFQTKDEHHFYRGQSIFETNNGTIYSSLGLDTSFYPWGCCPEKEYVANKHSIGVVDLDANVFWNKPVADNIWEFDRGINDMIETNQNDGLIVIGDQYGQFNLPDSTWGTGGIIAKTNYAGQEQWRRKYNYNPYPNYSAEFSLLNIVPAWDNNGYILLGQVYVNVHIGTLYSSNSSVIFYIDEYGCMIPGCEIVNQTSIQTGRLSLLTYPNPASDYLYIYIPTSDEITSHNSVYLHINDISGNRIYSEKVKVSDNTLIIETGHWNNGIYIASLMKNGQTIASEKVVVQR